MSKTTSNASKAESNATTSKADNRLARHREAALIREVIAYETALHRHLDALLAEDILGVDEGARE